MISSPLEKNRPYAYDSTHSLTWPIKAILSQYKEDRIV